MKTIRGFHCESKAYGFPLSQMITLISLLSSLLQPMPSDSHIIVENYKSLTLTNDALNGVHVGYHMLEDF